MDQKQASKLLFKKLSALRATLSDEEQLLLDSLLVGEFAVTAHGLVAANTAASTSKLAAGAEDAVAHKMNVASSLGKVAADAEDAVAHKMNVASSADRIAADIEDAVAHSALLNENDEKLAAFKIAVAYNNEDETYRLTVI